MGEFLKLSLIIGIIAIVIWFMKGLIRNATNSPTWEGIIISALIGMLPMYLIKHGTQMTQMMRMTTE